MPMHCLKCGTELKEGYKFCSSCGATVEHVEKTRVEKRFCPKCGTELAKGMEFCSSCGARTSEPGMEKAGVGARFGSYILDSVITSVIGGILGAVLFCDDVIAGYYLFGTVVSVGYFTYFFGNGQTPGMKVAKIKLCRTDGTYPIGYGKGFLRFIGLNISALVIGLGFLWILMDKNKQGWHDKIADTYVISE